MKQNNDLMELSYYRLTLLSYLKESHPERTSDIHFIKTRADEAAETYSDAIKEGFSHDQAGELTNLSLFRGLLFSKHDMLVDILQNEFSESIPENQAKEYAQKLLPSCEFLFRQYPLSDEFIDSFEYEKLYTELTGLISTYFEEHGVQ